MKALPPGSELRRRIKRTDDEPESSSTAPKKPKILDDDDKDDDDDAEEETEERRRNSAIEVTAEYLHKKLTPQNVADLVLLSMIVLPEGMPPQFQSSYTPIAAAGTEVL